MNVGPVSQTVVRRAANFGSASLHLAPASSIILSAQLRAGNQKIHLYSVLTINPVQNALRLHLDVNSHIIQASFEPHSCGY